MSLPQPKRRKSSTVLEPTSGFNTAGIGTLLLFQCSSWLRTLPCTVVDWQ